MARHAIDYGGVSKDMLLHGIRRYAEAMVEHSWKGSKTIEEMTEIEQEEIEARGNVEMMVDRIFVSKMDTDNIDWFEIVLLVGSVCGFISFIWFIFS